MVCICELVVLLIVVVCVDGDMVLCEISLCFDGVVLVIFEVGEVEFVVVEWVVLVDLCKVMSEVVVCIVMFY